MKILRLAILIAPLLTLMVSCQGFRRSLTLPMGLDHPQWAKEFAQVGVKGTLVVYDPVRGKWQFHNRQRADSTYSPASTFKVFNSLVGLQTRAVSNDSVVFPWDGEDRGWEKWNMDQSMKTAFRYSCVWYYQELARRIGKQRMAYWLQKVGYGNARMGSKIDDFWLEGDLAISAIGQVDFLFYLEAMDLPFSKTVQENVHRIMLEEEGNGWQLYAKTGWNIRDGRQIGWYVGFIHCGAERRIFAMNMDILHDEDAQYRKVLTRKLLKGEGLMPGTD